MDAVRHGEFTHVIELEALPAAVFAAFAEPERRAGWVVLPGRALAREVDFRAGGGEFLRSVFDVGDERQELENRTRFIEVAEGSRLVFTSESVVDGVVRWVSLVTVTFESLDGGTRVTWVEQYSFLVLTDPSGETDVNHLRVGTRLRLNGLPAAVAD